MIKTYLFTKFKFNKERKRRRKIVIQNSCERKTQYKIRQPTTIKGEKTNTFLGKLTKLTEHNSNKRKNQWILAIIIIIINYFRARNMCFKWIKLNKHHIKNYTHLNIYWKRKKITKSAIIKHLQKQFTSLFSANFEVVRKIHFLLFVYSSICFFLSLYPWLYVILLLSCFLIVFIVLFLLSTDTVIVI